MSAKNRTIATEFLLLGFTSNLRINIFLFLLFLAIYIISLTGNCLIMSLIVITPQLHTPMYFFLCILAFLDLCITTTLVPRLLADFLSTRRTISYAACALQFYTVLLMAGTECLLLALMAYDRYVAICRPLHYPVLMSWRTCYTLTASVCLVSFMMFIIPAVSMPLDLCYPNQINHFMCEALSIMLLACDDILLNEVLMFIICFTAIFLPFVVVIASYTCIIFSVLKMPSTGRSKAFSTCSSHVTVVALAYGSGFLMYFNPSSQYSMKYGKYFSLLSLIICPTLNPLIYTLNNREVKVTMIKVFLTSTFTITG